MIVFLLFYYNVMFILADVVANVHIYYFSYVKLINFIKVDKNNLLWSKMSISF